MTVTFSSTSVSGMTNWYSPGRMNVPSTPFTYSSASETTEVSTVTVSPVLAVLGHLWTNFSPEITVMR